MPAPPPAATPSPTPGPAPAPAPAATRRVVRRAAGLGAAVGFAVLSSAPAAAQDEGVRLGLSVGGIASLGVVVEFMRDDFSVDLNVGTWAFKDVSAAVTVRHYFGGSSLRPVLGAGLWGVWAPLGERRGTALLAQLPVGLDWRMTGDHYLDVVMNVNRALVVRRADPELAAEMNRRIVPLPGISYRWAR